MLIVICLSSNPAQSVRCSCPALPETSQPHSASAERPNAVPQEYSIRSLQHGALPQPKSEPHSHVCGLATAPVSNMRDAAMRRPRGGTRPCSHAYRMYVEILQSCTTAFPRVAHAP